MNGLDVIVEDLPIPYDESIDGLIEFEEIVEGDPLAEEMHMAHLFASRAGITLDNIKPDYRVTAEEAAWAKMHLPRNGLPRVGIQLLASAFYRNYPAMPEVMLALSKYAQVLLIGTPGQIELAQDIPNVTNLMGHRLDFRQSAALVSTCDACVSPDSVLVHLAAALDIPCVSLYGPFPSLLRVASDLAHPFDGVASCAPCFFHANQFDEFPEGMPCFKSHKCVAMESIKVHDVVNQVLKLLPHS
jgi:ADP-heptose:LPS heptosyltransferase